MPRRRVFLNRVGSSRFSANVRADSSPTPGSPACAWCAAGHCWPARGPPCRVPRSGRSSGARSRAPRPRSRDAGRLQCFNVPGRGSAASCETHTRSPRERTVAKSPGRRGCVTGRAPAASRRTGRGRRAPGPIGLRSRFQMSRTRCAPITSCPSASTTSATQREVTRPPARHGPPCTCRGASRSCRGGESRFRRGRPRGRPIVQRAWRVFAAAKAVPVRAPAATWLALRKQPHPAPAQGRPSSTDETSFLPPERCRPSRPPCLFHVEHRSALDSVTGPTVRGSRQPPSPARLALVPATARLAPRPLPFTALPSPLGFDSGATRAPTTPRGDLRRLAQTRRARPRTGRSHLPSRAAPPPP